MNGNDSLIGIVRDGKLAVLWPPGRIHETMRLTSIAVYESVPPEHGESVLLDYEGRTVMVSGHSDSGWLYSAQVVDTAGPLLAEVVKHVFGETGDTE